MDISKIKINGTDYTIKDTTYKLTINNNTLGDTTNGVSLGDITIPSVPTNEELGLGYGTCTTEAATAAKVVTLANYKLTEGGIVMVHFTNDVLANATLNINNKGAKPIYYNGAAIGAEVITAGKTASFMYDGSHYNLISDGVGGGSDGSSGSSTTPKTVTSYIIDQTNPYAPASDMIEIAIPAKYSNDNASVIHRIHSNTKLYAASTNLNDGKLQVRELNRNHKSMWTDGTLFHSSWYDFFMKLPEFWYKLTELTTDRYKVEFTMDSTTGSGSGWQHWEGNTFIGIYKAYVDSNKVYSYRNQYPTVNVSPTNFRSYARARGTGYQLVTYEAHKIMCLLGFGWLGTTDAKSIVGRGSNKTEGRYTGTMESKGINDTTANIDGGESDGSTESEFGINFWGLEDWWGGLSEIVDNIVTYYHNIKINDINGTTIRTITNNTTLGCADKMFLGEYGDMIPISDHPDGLYLSGFAASCENADTANYYFTRSGYYAAIGNNLCYLLADIHLVSGTSYITSRLLYQGDYEETNLT